VRFAVATVWAGTLGIGALGATGCTGTGQGAADGFATVVEVIDGDTVDVEFGGRRERVRMIGIDTPETKRPDSPVECFGPEASAFTESLLPVGAEVRVERDTVGRDDYGRLLGYVHLVDRAGDGDGDGEIFVNLEIIAAGFARPLTIEPNSTFAPDFAAAAGRAERGNLGMWAACSS
jgi:micrococcal nuclease